MFFRKSKNHLAPTQEELDHLAKSSTKFLASELQNLMWSSHGEYRGRPKREDLLHAKELAKDIPIGSSVSLIGQLRIDGDETVLYFRGKRLDSLNRISAKLVAAKLGSPVPVLFKLHHISSTDKTRSWPSIEITRQKKLT